MNQWLIKNIDKLAVIGAVLVIAALAFGARSNMGPVAGPPDGQSDTSTQRDGDADALTATMQPGRVYHAREENFAELVLNSDVPVLVDFYADWCGPCRTIAPVLEDLARETSDARIVKVNVDHSPQLAERYGIESIPNLKVFKDGRIVDEHAGLARKATLKKMLGI